MQGLLGLYFDVVWVIKHKEIAFFHGSSLTQLTTDIAYGLVA